MQRPIQRSTIQACRLNAITSVCLWMTCWTTMKISSVSSIPCTWNLTKTVEQREQENCGFRCENPWGKETPHYCGPPHPCCCAPICNVDAPVSLNSFLGINWNDQYMKRPIPRTHQFQILKDNGFVHIKTFTPSGLGAIRRVYGDTAHVYVGIPNRELTELATSLDYARKCVLEQLYEYRSIIKLVVVGNEPLLCIRTEDWATNHECGALNLPAKLLLAMKTMHRALVLEGMGRKVTTALNGGILDTSKNPWTPCTADFKEVLKPILKPIWQFLRETESPFIVNLYSWFASMNGNISPKLSCGVLDEYLPSDGMYNYYFNLDMQMDVVRLSMCKNDIQDLELWVGETGWPTGGHPKATLTNGYWYLEHTIRRKKGLHINDEQKDNFRFRGLPFTLFLFEAFDEEKKFEIEHGNKYENAFGLFYETGFPKWRDANGMIKFLIPGKRDRIDIPPQPL